MLHPATYRARCRDLPNMEMAEVPTHWDWEKDPLPQTSHWMGPVSPGTAMQVLRCMDTENFVMWDRHPSVRDEFRENFGKGVKYYFVVRAIINNWGAIYVYTLATGRKYVIRSINKATLCLNVKVVALPKHIDKVVATYLSGSEAYTETYSFTERCVGYEYQAALMEWLVASNVVTKNQKVVLLDENSRRIRPNRILKPRRFFKWRLWIGAKKTMTRRRR